MVELDEDNNNAVKVDDVVDVGTVTKIKPIDGVDVVVLLLELEVDT